MNDFASSSPVTPCPAAEEIRVYATGGHSEARAGELETHLLVCPHCETLLDSFDDPSDAVIQALTALPISQADESGYHQLRATICSNPPSFDNATAASAQLQHAGRLADPALGPLPCQLGNYELLTCIGRGASGAVYRARHLKLDQLVAIKVIDASCAFALESFSQEMKTLGPLAHPHIVRATDAGECDGLHFLVMEYIEGVDAARLLFHNGPLAVADACDIARQASLGLQFVHERSLVHRDIKPSNLLVTVEGQVKLLDLGIAVHRDQQQPNNNTEAKPQGTLDYMAPEQWSSPATIDPRTDLYSLGCTLFKLLTGCASPKPSVSISEFRPVVPRSLDRLLQRLLAEAPEDRPSSLEEVVEALQPLSRGANLPALLPSYSPSVPQAESAGKSRARWTRLPKISRRAAAVSIAAAGASAFLLSKLRFGNEPQLKRSAWRALAPLAPELLLTLSKPDQVEFFANENGNLRVSSDQLTLIHLGRPVTGVFSLGVNLQRDNWRSGGIFFNGQLEYTDGKRILRFQTFELTLANLPDDAAATDRRLLWSQWTAKRKDGQITIDQTPLAETAIEIQMNSATQHLQVTCGQQGMPEVEWNRQKLHESRWQFSIEARNQQRLAAGQVPTAYLGRLGVLNRQGTTTFIHPQLAYL